MRIAYLDCFSGMSGDMFLGALVDAGVPTRIFEEAVAALNIGARLEISASFAVELRRPRWMSMFTARRSYHASSIGNSMPTRMSARTGMTMIILITKSRLRCGSTISL